MLLTKRSTVTLIGHAFQLRNLDNFSVYNETLYAMVLTYNTQDMDWTKRFTNGLNWIALG